MGASACSPRPRRCAPGTFGVWVWSPLLCSFLRWGKKGAAGGISHLPPSGSLPRDGRGNGGRNGREGVAGALSPGKSRRRPRGALSRSVTTGTDGWVYGAGAPNSTGAVEPIVTGAVESNRIRAFGVSLCRQGQAPGLSLYSTSVPMLTGKPYITAVHAAGIGAASCGCEEHAASTDTADSPVLAAARYGRNKVVMGRSTLLLSVCTLPYTKVSHASP